MRGQVAKIGLVVGLLLLMQASSPSQQPTASAVIFRNDTKGSVIVQGISTAGGMVRRGQPVVVAAGHGGGDFNVTAGMRFYSVYDANQPSRVLAKDVPFNIPAGKNLLISIRPLPNNQVGLVPEAARP